MCAHNFQSLFNPLLQYSIIDLLFSSYEYYWSKLYDVSVGNDVILILSNFKSDWIVLKEIRYWIQMKPYVMK